MKKFLLTASMLVMGVVATFAQNWRVGEEITGKIGNPSFTEDAIAPWTFNHSGGNTTETGGLVELYDGSEADLFQYIELPAGMYKLECQGYYRIGTSWDVDPKTYGTDDWVDNAQLYVQNGKYNVDSKEFTAGRTFKTPLMPRLFDYQDSQIYVDEVKEGWDMSDGDYGEKGWGPCSVPGSLLWFAAGKYQPVDDGDNKYNTVTFFLTEDGYVKIGISKVAQSSADSFMATNFKLYYAGEAGEAAELMALQEEVDEYYIKLENMADNNPGFLCEKIGEELMLYNMEYGATSDMDKEEATKAKEILLGLLESANTAKNDLAALNAAIKAIDVLASTTDYAGKTALNLALEAAKASVSEDYEFNGEDWDTYGKLAEALYAARVDYLKSSPKTETGAWDFSPFIANRFFTNEENNPTWNAETGQWEYKQELKDAYPDFFNAMEFDGNNQVLKDQRAEISGDVVLSSSDNTVPFKWYKTGSNGPGWEVYYDHTMTSCKAWAPTPTSGISVIGQYLTGLPAGFYSLTGMAESWEEGADAIDSHFIIRSSTASSRSERAEPKNWYGGLAQNTWSTLSTDMIEVTDGDVWVEASVNGFYSITGFQLFYYGETPDFNAMIKPSLKSAQEAAEALTFEGDKKKAQEMLAKVPAKVDSKEVYLAASEAIAAANEYINTAKKAVDNWKGLDNFTNLLNKYEEGTVEKSIINVALAGTMEVGEGATDTYEDAIANNEQYTAYLSYMTYRESIGEFIKDAAVAPIVEEQNSYLTGNFATPEKLDEFKLAIGVEYNKAKFAAEGIDKATLTDPKSVTFLLINPSFEEGPTDESQDWNKIKGWTGEGTGAPTANNYSYDEKGQKTVAELWNRDVFTFSQVVSGLPAGTYELRARALYRDGGGVSANQVNDYVAAGGEENWKNNNAVLFAKTSDNEWRSYLKAIESLKATENSFTQCVTAWEYDADDQKNYPTAITYMAETIAEGDQQENIKYTSANEGSYPLDVKLTVTDEETAEEVTYYYPASMQGFYAACKKDPNAFTNSVIFYISESSNVELGIKKTKAISNDWVIMDDFELYYLGKEAPAAIEEVADNAGAQGAAEYYSINGVKLDAPQPGLNIVKFANGEVRKIFINK